MRNIRLVLQNNLQRLIREPVIIVMMIIILPIIIYFGIYFGQMDSLKGSIAVVGASHQQQNSLKESMNGNDKVNFEFLDEKPTKTELIKGIYLAEIDFTNGEPIVISYKNEEIKKAIEANIKDQVFEANNHKTTIEGKIIGFLIMYLLMGGLMIMDFFLTDRENGVYVRVLFGRLSYYEYVAGQILFTLCILTVPSIILSLVVLKILSVNLSINIALFVLLLLMSGLVSSSFSMLLVTLSKNKVSAQMGGSIIVMVTSLFGGSLINLDDSNKIISFIRGCLPQKRLIDLADSYNYNDLLFLIATIILFLLISVFVGKKQYDNGEFV